MRQFSRILIAAAIAASAACGGSSDGPSGVTGPGGQGSNQVTNGKFSATINGAAWSAVGVGIVSRSATNTLSITGGSPAYAMSFSLMNVTGPGAIALPANLGSGSLAVVGSSNQSGWATGYPGGAGTITITTLTSSHVVGTFSFDAVSTPGGGGSGGTLQVRNGTFDLTF